MLQHSATSPSTEGSFADKLIERLITICKDRGNRAHLRRWWSPSTRHYAYPVLGRLGVIDNHAGTLVAALYAIHDTDGVSPHRANKASVGKAMLELQAKNEGIKASTDLEPTATEKHFQRLLACDDAAELGDYLQRIVKRLQKDSISLDYVTLLNDLRYWSERTKQRWAADFWQSRNGLQP